MFRHLQQAHNWAKPRSMTSMQSTQPRAIANWLFVCILLVGLMAAVGGITRLTESGLSIVKWKLISGTLPPLSATAWQEEFLEYQQSPQFKQVNRDFSLGDFKHIFWLEYLHRLLGRIIGMAVILPLLYFSARRMLLRPLVLRCVAIALLIAAQGTVGWIMVASGLNDQPRVEPLKLAAHLLLAFSVFSLMLWTRWQVLGSPRPVAAPAIARTARCMLALLVMQIVFGALVAGLRAGLTYNTYPRMDGQWIPSGLHLMQPWWLNHLESALTVQFQHRIGALLVVAGILSLVAMCQKHTALRPTATLLIAAVLVQFTLGVATLLSGVNLWLASAHQLVALGLLALLMRLLYLAPLDVNQYSPKNGR